MFFAVCFCLLSPQFLGRIKTCLPKLRTLNIRNMPEIDSLIPQVPADTQVKGIALTWVDEMIAAGLSDRVRGGNDSGKGLPPPISVLAFGCLRYVNVWNDGSYTEDKPMDEFTVLRTFTVDYFTRSSGGFAPVLTQKSWGPPYGISAEYANTSIFLPYWLS